MRALILAAGRGSRMLNLTKDQPKCLIKLAGKTLLEWQIDALKKVGIDRFTIVTGYKADLLKELGYDCLYNPQWKQTNMVESLCCAGSILACEEVTVGYGDIVYHTSILNQLLQAAGDVVVTYDLLWESLWNERFINPLQNAETLRIKDGKIKEIGQVPTHLDQIEGQYMGLLKITPRGWKNIGNVLNKLETSIKGRMYMTTLLQHLIDDGFDVNGAPILGRWCEADTEEDINCYEQKLQGKGSWSHDWRI